MAAYTRAISSAIALLLFVSAIDGGEWKLGRESTGHFNSPHDYNINGAIQYTGEKNSFSVDAQSSAHPIRDNTHQIHAYYTSHNDDGSKFHFGGGVRDSSYKSGYNERTDSAGVGYTFPNGLNVKAEYKQTRDNSGRKNEEGGLSLEYPI